ncbi:UvrB/UvrC motif-containing protein [Bacillus songklensis]|uniref:UvrB/UvrC motif-containing protein n=1 Tax=Bacillus songklensis TaxID=1069116 RepID=A0ABV8B7U2_9BACI
MVCQQCNIRAATLHFTKVINGEKSEIHLCEHCAKESGEMFSIPGNTGFSINNLLAGLLNVDSAPKESSAHTFTHNQVVQCPNCKLTYRQFAKFGRFGCAHCYETFRSSLTPFLKRLHAGNHLHKGKIPKRIGSNLHLKKELEKQKLKLKEYIAQEEFEKAATLRDEIRALEKTLREKREGEA